MTLNDHIQQPPGPLPSSNPLFYELDILKRDDIIKFNVCQLFHSCINHSSLSIFHDWYEFNIRILSYNTTSAETKLLHTKYSRLVHFGGKSLKVAGPLLWNGLPENLRNLPSIFSFKNRLKCFLLSQYIL